MTCASMTGMYAEKNLRTVFFMQFLKLRKYYTNRSFHIILYSGPGRSQGRLYYGV